MKKRAATGMVFLCILAMAGLAACRSDEQLPGTAEEIINTVCSRLGRAGELDADLSVDMDMDVGGSPLKLSVNSRVSVMKNPNKVQMSVHSDVGDGQAAESLIYMADEGDFHYAYAKWNDLWRKVEITEEDVADRLAGFVKVPSEELAPHAGAFTIARTEEEEGRELTVLTGELPKECLPGLIKCLGLTEQMGMDFGKIDVGEWGGAFPTTIWVDNGTVTVHRMSVDFSSFMETAYRELMVAVVDSYKGEMSDEALNKQGMGVDELGVRVGRFDVGVRYRAFRGVEGFEVPAEAVNTEASDATEMLDLFVNRWD